MKKMKKKVKMHVKVGDSVKVISGQDKGKISLVQEIIRSKSQIIVEGVNIKIKHVKPMNSGETGEIKQIELPIHSSNVSKC